MKTIKQVYAMINHTEQAEGNGGWMFTKIWVFRTLEW